MRKNRGQTFRVRFLFMGDNKVGAMVVINAIISGDITLPQNIKLRELPAVATRKLSTDEKAAFDTGNLVKGVLSRAESLGHPPPEIPAKLISTIEKIVFSEVAGK